MSRGALDHDQSDGTAREVPVLGWREWVRLPDLGIRHIKAKIDTGARSSSLHAFDIETFEREGLSYVRFQVHPRQRCEAQVLKLEAPVIEFRHVRSSSGQASVRPVIRTTVQLLGVAWPIDLTLANRRKMGFRLLMGREAVRGRFVIDPGRSYCTGRPKRKRDTP